VNLKTARASYGGPQTHVNGLWRIIAQPFLRDVLAQVGDPEYSENLYVRQTSPAAVTRADLERHLDSPSRRLLLVVGHPGVGKSTFLHHELLPLLTRERRVHAWVDVMRCLVASDSADRVQRTILRQLSGGLQTQLGGQVMRSWQRFLIEHRLDVTGQGQLVLDELDRLPDDAPLGQEAARFIHRTMEDAELDLLETLRIKLRFVREVLRRTPVLVIDNIDQLRNDAARALVDLAYMLAEGSGSPRPDPSAQPCEVLDSAKVLVAVRPVTLSRAKVLVGSAIREQVNPPSMSEVMRLRLEHFLAGFPGRVLKGVALEESRDVGEALGPGEHLTDGEARLALVEMTSWLTCDRDGASFSEPATHLRKLTNSNIRLCLLATAGYLASGHLDWVEVVRAARAGEPARKALTPRKIKHALYLGTQAVYSADGSNWLLNLFSDGAADEHATLLRPHLLRMLYGRGRESRRRVFEDAELLFEHPRDRMARAWALFLDRNLIDEDSTDRFFLTEAGESYLRMPSDFEYLQHVVMDAYVDNDRLVRCTSTGESKVTRLDRVVKFACWVRDLEIASLRRVHERRLGERYRDTFRDDLMCTVLAACVEQALDSIVSEESEGSTRIRGAIAALRASTTFEAVARAAMSGAVAAGQAAVAGGEPVSSGSLP
jgi:hypothetical protein